MTSIEQQIIDNVIATLGEIRRSNGYHCDLIVEEHEQLGNIPRDSMAVIYRGDPRPEESPSHGHDGYHLPLKIHCTIIESVLSGTTVDERLSLIAADVIKAMNEDYHRGDLAHDTRFIDSEKTAEASPPAVDVNFEIHYRTLHGNPFAQ